MDIPAGNTISRVSRTKKLLFPDQGSNIGTDLTALLETVLIGRKLMEDVEAFISCSRKRKAVELDASQKSTSKCIKSKGAATTIYMFKFGKNDRAIFFWA